MRGCHSHQARRGKEKGESLRVTRVRQRDTEKEGTVRVASGRDGKDAAIAGIGSGVALAQTSGYVSPGAGPSSDVSLVALRRVKHALCMLTFAERLTELPRRARAAGLKNVTLASFA